MLLFLFYLQALADGGGDEGQQLLGKNGGQHIEASSAALAQVPACAVLAAAVPIAVPVRLGSGGWSPETEAACRKRLAVMHVLRSFQHAGCVLLPSPQVLPRSREAAPECTSATVYRMGVLSSAVASPRGSCLSNSMSSYAGHGVMKVP